MIRSSCLTVCLQADCFPIIAGATGSQGPAGEQGIQGTDGLQGPKGEAGQAGTVKGAYATEAELRAAQTPGVEGEFYIVGDEINGYELWIWDSLALPDGDWMSAGAFSGIEGPQGPQGPQGEQGPTGALELGDELFTVSDETDSEAIGYQSSLEFKSDTLDVSVENGPVVRIERPYNLGTLVNFSSGQVQTFSTGFFGARSRFIVVGQSSNVNLGDLLADPVDALLAVGHIFPMPASGTINAFSAFFTLNTSTGLPGSFDTRVIVSIYRASDDTSSIFYAIPGAAVTMAVPNTSTLGVTYASSLENLSIQVAAGDRLMIGVYTETQPEYAASTTIGGYVSGAIRFL